MTERPDEPRDVLDSDANVGEKHGLAGSMGVSSERVGKVRGSSEPATHGTESTASADPVNPPSEQSADPASGPETNPDAPGGLLKGRSGHR